MAVNLKSAFLITQAVLPPMRAARWGRIINLSSVAAQTGGVVGPHYATLADGVLWDEDWKDNESLLDADPKASRAVKKLMGIDEDYYIAVPPDPTDEEMVGVWATLRKLTQDTAGPE